MNELSRTDPLIADLISQEDQRQRRVLRMIPSENYASAAVRQATGSILTNKYSEGYPYKRYYQGQQVIDQIEETATKRARELFGAEHANVQPYSGSPANMAVYFALAGPGGKVMGMDLSAGGHLTHGSKISFSGYYHQIRQYGLNRDTCRLDYDRLREEALKFRPRIIFSGASSYPRVIDFAILGEIAREVEAYLVADISHISGLCLSGDHPHPLPHADIVTTTTHKMLRGPRGGLILCSADLAESIDKAVFPGLQGGPHNHVTAAIAVALREAAQPEFNEYCHQVVKNAATLAEALLEKGFTLVTDGTDNHMVVIDTTPLGITGRTLAEAMDTAGLVANANKIPFDKRPAWDPSGVRMGTPALTTRGMREAQMKDIAELIRRVAAKPDNPLELDRIRAEAEELCGKFPI
jgi:glycine hydroxymethyltransferase